MSVLRMVYLGLAIIGAVLPYRYFLEWFGENGFDLPGMIDAWHANTASSGLVWDLTIAAAALSVWILAEVYVRRDYLVGALCIAATFCIGVSCGLPLYLFLRTRPAAYSKRPLT